MDRSKQVRAELLGSFVWCSFLVAGTALGASQRSVTMPYSVTDGGGGQWQVYANGMVQQNGGNVPVFSQLGQMTVNGGGMPMMRGNASGKVDDKTGELTLENLTVQGGIGVTRRVLISKDESTVRYIDSFKNAGNKDVTVTLQYSSNFNFGIQSGRMVQDARKKDQNVGWAGMTHGNRALFQAYGISGAKVSPKITYPEGSNVLQTAFALTVPAGKEISIVHFHGSIENLDKAADAISSLKPAKLLAGVAPEIRRSIVNIPARSVIGDDLEVLRGDSLDVVETRNGDQLRGTLKDASYPLKTAFGRLELPADKVIGVLTVGKQRPMQLVVTGEGEIFGGIPERDYLTLQLSSGQTVKVPVNQVARAGYRRRPGEPEEIVLTRPAVSMRTGERMAVEAPAGPVEIATRYGLLKLPPASILAVTLKADDTPVHLITLSDGSRFSGLLTAPKFDLALNGAAGKVALTVPTASIARFRPSPILPDSDDVKPAPELKCSAEDSFVGTLEGAFLLDTAFEAVEVKGDQVRKIARPEPGSTELQVTLWDQTMITGQPREATLSVKLGSGVALAVPVDLIESYDNPIPKPSDDMAARIKELVAKLNDDDFKARETAQQALIGSGSGIATLLKELREAQPPEAQQRIDQILGQLDK